MTTREVHFRVRNLNSDDYEKLRYFAKAETGKASVSLLARRLLLKELALKNHKIKPFAGQTNRVEIRLDQYDLDQLQERALAENMTLNGYISFLMQSVLAKKPLLTTKEVEVLYQSNAQLLRIGRNINQIAKSLNTNNPTALSTQWIDKVPNLTNYREPEVRVRWITKESARSLIENVHLSWMQDVCEFALHTGARANEILTLEWDNVDLDAAVAWIINSRAKSGRARSLPLNTEAISLLRRRKLAGGQWVFTRSTGNPALEIDRRVFNSACEKTGITNFRFHDLRHRWVSWHVQARTPLFVLKELGGWETLEMVKKYAHLDASHLAGYVNQGTFRS